MVARRARRVPGSDRSLPDRRGEPGSSSMGSGGPGSPERSSGTRGSGFPDRRRRLKGPPVRLDRFFRPKPARSVFPGRRCPHTPSSPYPAITIRLAGPVDQDEGSGKGGRCHERHSPETIRGIARSPSRSRVLRVRRVLPGWSGPAFDHWPDSAVQGQCW